MAVLPFGIHDKCHPAPQGGRTYAADMTAKVPLREKHATETRQRIVAEAMSLFVARGYASTTVDEIAEAADVSPRTFFRYFATKEALLFHDFEDRLAGIRDQILGRPAEESPVQALVAVLCTAVDDIHRSPEQRALMLQLVHERPAVLAYQRATVADHAEGQIVAAVSARAGLPADDLGIRAVVSAVAACHHLAMTDWVRAGAHGPFADAFLRTLRACAPQFPDPAGWGS